MKRVLLILCAVLAVLLIVLALRYFDVIPRPIHAEPLPTVAQPQPPAPQPVSTPEPPAPDPEPPLEQGEPLTFNGRELAPVIVDETLFASADALAAALGSEYSFRDDVAEFTGPTTARFTEGERKAVVDGRDEKFKNKPFIREETLYIPVEELAEVLDCGDYTDSETGDRYLTPGCGDWDIPPDRRVAVMEYHAVSNNMWGIEELFVDPAEMERQLAYLVEHDYDPIWFEDLRNIDQYDKPVILTFDDGYDDNYLELLPLLEKYQVKATVFVIVNPLGTGHSMTQEQVRMLSESGLVAIESHGLTHHDMGAMDEEEIRYELGESKRILTGITGKEPLAMSYPEGKYNPSMLEIYREYYKFAVKMNGRAYNTSDEPLLAGRYYVSRYTTLEEFAAMLEEAHGEE